MCNFVSQVHRNLNTDTDKAVKNILWQLTSTPVYILNDKCIAVKWFLTRNRVSYELVSRRFQNVAITFFRYVYYQL